MFRETACTGIKITILLCVRSPLPEFTLHKPSIAQPGDVPEFQFSGVLMETEIEIKIETTTKTALKTPPLFGSLFEGFDSKIATGYTIDVLHPDLNFIVAMQLCGIAFRGTQ